MNPPKLAASSSIFKEKATQLHNKQHILTFFFSDGSFALPRPELVGRQQRARQNLEPLGAGAGTEDRGVAGDGARVGAVFAASDAPTARNEHARAAVQEVGVYAVEHRIVAPELSGERSVAVDHLLHVGHGEVVRVLLRRVVPRYVVQVRVNCRVPKLRGIANHRVEIPFRGRDKVSVVHKDRSG